MNRYAKMIKGFTLLELLITLAIAAIVTMLAAPSFDTLMKNSRMTTGANGLLGAFHAARAQAAALGRVVVVCPSADPNAVSPACAGAGTGWDEGYLVFAPGPGNATNPPAYQAGDTLARVGEGVPGVQVRTNAERVAFRSDGPLASGTAGGAIRFVLCDDRGAPSARVVTVRPVGGARIEPAKDGDCDA